MSGALCLRWLRVALLILLPISLALACLIRLYGVWIAYFYGGWKTCLSSSMYYHLRGDDEEGFRLWPQVNVHIIVNNKMNCLLMISLP